MASKSCTANTRSLRSTGLGFGRYSRHSRKHHEFGTPYAVSAVIPCLCSDRVQVRVERVEGRT